MPLQGHAEVITYTWFNAPSVQQNDEAPITTKTLSGTITVDTTALASIGEGKWRIGDSQESSITAWNFTVTGGVSYSESDQSTAPFLDIAGGGTFSLVASRTQLSVEAGASLFLGNSLSVNQTTILWNNGQSGHSYLSNLVGNVNPNGWVTDAATTIDPEATLDAAFPSDGLGGWVIATAVPEPATFSMAIFGIVAAAWQLLRRRRWLLVPLAMLVAIGVGVHCGTATATLIAYDPFNQSATTTIAGTSSTSPGVWPTGGQAWGDVAGGPVEITSGSLSVPSGVLGLSTNGNSATLLNNAGTQVAAFRKLGTTYDTSTETDLWFSFLYRPADRTDGVGINEGISLFNNTTEVLFFGSDGPGDLVIRAVGGQSADTERFANTFLDATSKQTFQIVANVRGTTEYTIWVDPTGFDSNLGIPTGGTKAFLATGLQTFSFDTIRLGDDTTTSSSQGVATFDEFRMATTAVEVVPEPSTSAMALGGVAAFFWRRSRRSRRSR